MTVTACWSRPPVAATAWTRKGNDWSDKFRSIGAAAKLPAAGCLIDGEAVALDKRASRASSCCRRR